MKALIRFVRKYPLACFCIALTWYLCLFRPPRVKLLESITYFDKIVHLVMYLGTCSIIWWEYLHRHKEEHWTKLILLAIIGPILMSGAIELAQEYLTTNRSGDYIDFAANSTGVLLAAVIGHFCLRPYINSRKKLSS